MSQIKYSIDLLAETGMVGCYPTDMLVEFNAKLGNSGDRIPVDKE